MRYKVRDVFDDVTKYGTKIKTSQYLEHGKYPIFDQGKDYIAGYTNEDEGIFQKVPVILFGDHTGILKYITRPCFLGADGVKLLKPKDSNIVVKYLFYALNNVNIPDAGYSRHFKWLKEGEIPIPPKEQQSMIVEILDELSYIVQKEKEMLIKFDELVKSRFLEMFGMSEGRDKHLEDVADICSGITKGRKVLGLELREVPYMAVSNVKMGYIDLSTVKTIMATESEIEQYRLFSNDILMTEGGDPDKVGRGAIIRNPPKDCIHQNHIFRVRLHKDVLLPEFFEEYLQGDSARRYFLKAAKQTTGIASINMKQLRALPVKIPPIKVQIQYSDFVHQVDKSKMAVQKSLDELETLKKSLMQTYFG